MNKKTLIALSVILGIYAAVHAERPAGIVLYFESGNEWIPYSELEKHLLTSVNREKKHPIDMKFLPGASNTDWFWPVWLGNIRRAIEVEALPWSKE